MKRTITVRGTRLIYSKERHGYIDPEEHGGLDNINAISVWRFRGSRHRGQHRDLGRRRGRVPGRHYLKRLKQMLTWLLRLFGIRLKRHRRSKWVYLHVGRIVYGKVEGKIPKWVLSDIGRIRERHGGSFSSLHGLRFAVNGRHRRYRVEFSGQGGPIVDVAKGFRRARRGNLLLAQ